MIERIKTKSREEWLALRKNYIGGSDAAAIIGLNAYASPYSVWAEKTGRVSGFEGNLATEVGTYLEEFVAKLFEKETGKKVKRNNFSMVNDQYPWAIADIDREVVGEDAGLEIKTTSALSLHKFKNGEYPENYYVQCVHYLAVTGKKRWYLAVLIGNSDFRIFTIERDETEIQALMQAESEFAKHIIDDTPPLIDGNPATSEAIKAAYQTSEESVCDLSAFEDLLKQRKALKEQDKVLSDEIERIDNLLKETMRESEKGKAGPFTVSWKTSGRNTINVKRLMEENKNIDYEPYYEYTTSRTFRITERKGA